jgi:hypothetical protein
MGSYCPSPYVGLFPFGFRSQKQVLVIWPSTFPTVRFLVRIKNHNNQFHSCLGFCNLILYFTNSSLQHLLWHRRCTWFVPSFSTRDKVCRRLDSSRLTGLAVRMPAFTPCWTHKFSRLISANHTPVVLCNCDSELFTISPLTLSPSNAQIGWERSVRSPRDWSQPLNPISTERYRSSCDSAVSQWQAQDAYTSNYSVRSKRIQLIGLYYSGVRRSAAWYTTAHKALHIVRSSGSVRFTCSSCSRNADRTIRWRLFI